ncbi:MAG: aldehyde dehydrogenase family protein, partial [bacterium]
MSQNEYQLLIDGEWRGSDEGTTFEVVNPANGQTVATCAEAGRAETVAALEAAQVAFPAWARTSARERAQIMH